jgi:hypothetical protein
MVAYLHSPGAQELPCEVIDNLGKCSIVYKPLFTYGVLTRSLLPAFKRAGDRS